MLCIAVPCHMFKLWAFIGIMFQVPLVVITKFLQNKFKSSMVCLFFHLIIESIFYRLPILLYSILSLFEVLASIVHGPRW
ncbi:hypothetical protein NC651_038523 [Populus alba x Populus x berolinensis]|nr:hypothetical protein NC651_038523 [Populus alba x Populus x berolinensis]